MKLSGACAYAVQAVVLLACDNSHAPVPCNRLAHEGEMPERFLLQVLRQLVTHGVLNSTRGVVGGYQLARPADQIALVDVIEAVDGPLQAELPAFQTLNDDARCRLTDAIQLATNAARDSLQGLSIADLIPAQPSKLGEIS